MLHILLLAVRWIGIVLLCLLALIVSAAALVLFCSFRYRAEAKKAADGWGAQGRVTWLFGLIRVTVRGNGEGMDVQIRICGIRLSLLSDLKKRLSQRQKKGIKKPRIKKNAMQGPPPVTDKTTIETETHDEEDKESVHKEEGPSREGPTALPDEEDIPQPRINLFRRSWIKLLEICRKIKEAFLGFIAMIRGLHDRVDMLKGFLGDPRTKNALGLSWEQLMSLLRHVGPQRWAGFTRFGLGDPAATGQALAVLGAAYPIHRGQITVDPVWDEKVLEGRISVKGRVYGILVLCRLGRIFFDRDVRYVISHLRQNGGNYVTGK